MNTSASANARDDFLSRISGALGRDAVPDRPASPPPDSVGAPDELAARAALVRELMERGADSLFDTLAISARTAGWNVARVPDARAAGDYALEVARDIEARSGVFSLDRAVQAALRADRFAAAGIDLTPIALDRAADPSDYQSERDRLRAIMASADFGVTGADYAIAETGTCVIIPKTGVSRLASLLPPVHIALVRRGQTLPSLDELFTLRRADFAADALGSYMNLITGPSRTADIEYQIVTGVHGPGEVHMVLIG